MIEESLQNILNASEFALGTKKTDTQKSINISKNESLLAANVSIGQMFDEMSIDILKMLQNAKQFSKNVEAFVIEASSALPDEPKLKVCIYSLKIKVVIKI